VPLPYSQTPNGRVTTRFLKPFFLERVHSRSFRSKWAIFGKQNWRRGMNQKSG